MTSAAAYMPTVPLARGMETILVESTNLAPLVRSGASLMGVWRVPKRLGQLAWRCGQGGGLPWQGAPQSTEERLQAAARLQRTAAAVCEAHGVKIKIEGTLPEQLVIVVANHVSYVDTIVLPTLLACTCVAKKEVARWTGVGALASRLGTIFVERGNPSSGGVALRQAMRALAAGVNVAAFPEGTTSPGDRVLPFHRGVFGLARLMKVPVLPVCLVYDNPRVAWVGDDPFLPHYLGRVAAQRETVVTVRTCRLLDPERYASATAMARAAQRVLADALLG